ncbi:NXPE family member 1-like [Biomphalaria glabrata]|uniref:NXPE family member 1-like n=1 Tax=Biomphalaria glabrata TaxID=6526 RepID=A0A9W3AZ09_BIOGL|nr:NXPE family member 1-like [Biomphalaria glabrata]
MLKSSVCIKTRIQWLAVISFFLVFLVFFSLNQTSGTLWASLNNKAVSYNDRETSSIKVTTGTQWRQVSLADAIKSFSDQTMDACNNTCDRSDNSSDCSTFTKEDWSTRLTAEDFIVRPFLKDGMYIYEFEKEYLSYPPLEDMKQLPDLNLSTITVFGSINDTVHCDIGDVIRGRVDLVDSYGHSRHRGGDEVRMWLVSKSKKQFRTSGHVTDLNNGSYLITGHCLWPGNIQINVAVVYPREYIRTVIHQAQLSASRFIYGNFIRNTTQEATICWSLPNIIGRSCVCNLTYLTGQPFYCGQPVDARLTCKDWAATSAAPLIQPINVTMQERNLILKIPTRHILERAVPHSIQVLAKERGQLPKLKSCSQTSLKVTWNLTTPGGFWDPNMNWMSLHCERPGMSSPWAMSCLKNTTILIIGDSNAVRLFRALSQITHCTGLSSSLWPKAGTCRNKDANIILSFTPHELPLYQHSSWTPKLNYKGVAEQISATPSVGKYIIIVHYYLHATPSHLSVVHSRIKSLAEAIRHLARRNPDVLFAFRGPHVTSFDWDINHTIGGDSLGTLYLQLIQETFQDLRDKIVYLDGWGMTIALENAEFHPTDRVPQEMIRTLLSFRCNETGYVPR